MLVLLKNHLNYLKDSIFKCFLKKYDRFLFIYLFIYLFILIFFATYNDGKFKAGKTKHN